MKEKEKKARIAKLRKTLEVIKSNFRILEISRRKTEQEIAELACPYKYGDILVSNTLVYGIVDQIKPSRWAGDYTFTISRITKGFEFYKHVSEPRHGETWELANPEGIPEEIKAMQKEGFNCD